MRPIIGITTGFQPSHDGESPAGRTYLATDYSDAVLAAGGLPQLIATPRQFEAALLDDLVRRVDGLLFTGGPDIDPRHFGEPRHEKTEVMHPRREAFELALFRRADEARVPILAICLGFQLTHVARGGELVQHIPDLKLTPAIEHRANGEASAWHSVRIEPDSRIAAAVGTGPEIEVNSRHHQGVLPEHAGRGLRSVARAPDGLLEGSEDLTGGRLLLAVQWHPENLYGRQEHLRLFETLVREAQHGM